MEAALPPKKRRSRPAPARPTQWVAVLPEKMISSDEYFVSNDFPAFVPLNDPKTGIPRQYLISQPANQICELQRYSNEPRSWFINDSIQTDGSLLLCTPIDPLFLALPYLVKAGKAGKFTTLEAILDDPTWGSVQLESYVQPNQWQHLCDVKELSSGIQVYRYNQDKTLQWLRKKVAALAAYLQLQGVQVGSGSLSSALVRSKRQAPVTPEEYVRYACGMTSEYLGEELAVCLTQSYSVNVVRRAEESSEQPPAKKPRSESVDSGMFSQPSSMEECGTDSMNMAECGADSMNMAGCGADSMAGCGAGSEPLEDYTKVNDTSSLPLAPPNKIKKQSSAQRTLSKVDKTGMKALSSFFGKTKT